MERKHSDVQAEEHTEEININTAAQYAINVKASFIHEVALKDDKGKSEKSRKRDKLKEMAGLTKSITGKGTTEDPTDVAGERQPFGLQNIVLKVPRGMYYTFFFAAANGQEAWSALSAVSVLAKAPYSMV